jgi:long-chain acyl-CoA synthetase
MKKVWLGRYPQGIEAQIDLSLYQSINEVFDDATKKFAGRPAFSCMGTTMTFRQLDEAATAFAAFLRYDLGLVKGDRIGLQMPNVLQYPVAMFGALKAGLVIVNTNPLYTEREMRHQFADAGCKAVVILANFAHHLEKVIADTKIERVVVTEIGDLYPLPKRLLVNAVVRWVKKMVPPFRLPAAVSFCAAMAKGRRRIAAGGDAPGVPCALDEVAFLQYTGGTTGVAKGAMLTHRNIVANMLQIAEWMKPRLRQGEEVAIAALPLYHIFSLTVNGLAILRYGGHNVLITNPKDINGFVKEIRASGWTVMTGVNTLFNALMSHPGFAQLDFSGLKISVAGGMALQTSVAARWQSITGSVIAEGYGLTETSPVATCNPIDGTDRPGTIGLPLPSTEIKMVDDNDADVPFGVAGELCVRGPQVMAGYWQRDDETAKVMLPGGWLRTGDIAIMDDDGFSRIVDRKKDMILVSGFNVYPNEVEDAIAMMPGVLEVAAIGVPSEHSGEAVKAIVVKRDPSLTAEQVIAHAREQLAGYKVPRLVEFRPELPKTNVGKILRRQLRDTESA